MYLEVCQGKRSVGEELDGESHNGRGGFVAGDEQSQHKIHYLVVGKVVT